MAFNPYEFGVCLGAVVVCFLIGSIPFGFWVARLRGIDIRQHGSGNIGATNVGRVLGKPWGWLVFGLDYLKGFGPLALLLGWMASDAGRSYILQFGVREAWLQASLTAAGLAAILGHNYTPWLGFKGGKGIATSAGVLTALLFKPFLACVAVWVLVFLAFRYVSLASVGAAITLPIGAWFWHSDRWDLMAFALLAGVLGIGRHRANIARLRAGTEPKVAL